MHRRGAGGCLALLAHHGQAASRIGVAHDLAARLRGGGSKTFVYYATFAPPGAEYAYHCADYICALNNLDAAPDGGWTDRDRKIEQVMSDYWLNFARTGDPNGPGLPRWPAYDPARPQVLNEGDVISAMDWRELRGK